MPAKWKEISAYTGQPVEEDAPTNSIAQGKVALPPDAMMKKKKKPLIDARTKAYKEHKARLEAKTKESSMEESMPNVFKQLYKILKIQHTDY